MTALTFRRPVGQRAIAAARMRRPTAWEVERDGVLLGWVQAIEMPSHIRRGRMQASPWWQAYHHGRLVTAPSRWAGPGGTRPDVDRWQTRREAAEALVAAADQAAAVTYHPERCCACRWIVWNEECGHPESDGIESPHDHCELHGGGPEIVTLHGEPTE